MILMKYRLMIENSSVKMLYFIGVFIIKMTSQGKEQNPQESALREVLP